MHPRARRRSWRSASPTSRGTEAVATATSGDDRVECAIADECGGCSLIGTTYSSQLEARRSRVRAELASYERLAGVDVAACVAAPANSRYRNRAKVAVGVEGDSLRIGLYARGTNHIVDLAPCRVQRPAVQAALESVRVWLEIHRLARPAGPVIYLDLRESLGGRCHITLVVGDDDLDPSALPVDDLIERCPEIEGVAINYGSAVSSYPMGDVTRAVLGDGHFAAPAYELTGDAMWFRVPAAGFFQVAPALLRDIHLRMFEYLISGDDVAAGVLDLYCGVGVHGLAIAGIAHERDASREYRLVGIEASGAAVDAAQNNAARLGVDARFVADRVDDVLEDVLHDLPAKFFDDRSAPAVILNPGRAGCRRAVLDALIAYRPMRVAYLSCDPRTLARDLDVLAEAGAGLRAVIPYDLMPQTDHVETLALIELPAARPSATSE